MGETPHAYLEQAARAYAHGAETQCTASLLAGLCLATARRHVAGKAAENDLDNARTVAGQVLGMEARRVPPGIVETVALCVLAIEATTRGEAEGEQRAAASCCCG